MRCIVNNKNGKATLCVIIASLLLMTGCAKPEPVVSAYEAEHYNKSVFKYPALFAEELCVTAENVSLAGAPDTSRFKAAGLFDLSRKQVDFAYNIHEKLYPASTTKIMTALVALKNGNLDDVVTVSADAVNLAPDEQNCGLKAGDKLTLRDLLNGLLIYSGNDNANAIAEHVGGSTQNYANMMNEQAAELMATDTHFANASGLHNENHYTTAYDLYLIFTECLQQPIFMDIIKATTYTANITSADGTMRQSVWEPTNFYALGEAALPANAVLIGGKTGTTKDAGNCLILLENDAAGNPHISIVMGAETKPILYEDMTALINAIPNKE